MATATNAKENACENIVMVHTADDCRHKIDGIILPTDNRTVCSFLQTQVGLRFYAIYGYAPYNAQYLVKADFRISVRCAQQAYVASRKLYTYDMAAPEGASGWTILRVPINCTAASSRRMWVRVRHTHGEVHTSYPFTL